MLSQGAALFGLLRVAKLDSIGVAYRQPEHLSFEALQPPSEPEAYKDKKANRDSQSR